MNPHRPATLITTAFSLAVFVTAGCTAKERPIETSVPPPNAASARPTLAAAPGPAAAKTSTQWQDIKTCTYDARARLFADLKLLAGRVDEQIGELTAKRSAMNERGTDLREWDFAMKEMVAARSYLQGMTDEMHHASRENWNQQKDKVGLAWVRTQEAYAKVNSSTTQ